MDWLRIAPVIGIAASRGVPFMKKPAFVSSVAIYSRTAAILVATLIGCEQPI
jgi:hypothetical protein